MAVLLVIALGMGIGALGLLREDLYVVGAVMVFIGLVGLVVRAVEWLRWLRQ
ncbi:hypothetical protein [Geodermatophilus ruber]|nr:hypothetical protein [Geodermatophilus ruber]